MRALVDETTETPSADVSAYDDIPTLVDDISHGAGSAVSGSECTTSPWTRVASPASTLDEHRFTMGFFDTEDPYEGAHAIGDPNGVHMQHGYDDSDTDSTDDDD